MTGSRHGNSRRVRGNPIRRLAVRTDRRSLEHPTLGRCWLWTGHALKGGYRQINVKGRTMLAHRWAYELLVGPIPDGLTLDHLCRNPSCVNPRHLEPVTMRENNLRGLGVSGVNARKTHCKHGHPYDERNTYKMPNGGRDCRVCINARSKKYKQARLFVAR